jgi:hypothetical protein
VVVLGVGVDLLQFLQGLRQLALPIAVEHHMGKAALAVGGTRSR